MTLAPYTKPHATAVQRVAHLRSRGLIVKRPNVAARKIDLVGYERLRIYFLSRRQLGVANRPFRPGTTYQQILRLYDCDSLLRDACFAAVGQFELLLRNAMSEALSDGFGSHPYFDLAAFKDAGANLEALQSFMTAYSQSKDQRAAHYRHTYATPILPPIWTMKEFLTFGRSVRIFKCLEGSVRTHIATQFGVPSDQVFTSWLECLVDVRNICAHHDRLFNRSFQKQPQSLRRAAVPTAPRNKLKAILECLDHLLTQRGAPVGIVADVGRILARFPEVQPAEVGY
ncbi:Abi family protein [Sphingomonas ginsenosidivorax]|uniref:Abi family protein n=1 Tax=Sphingomonas ginsenosidivorax TaxID=862135 RepID=A0A5C6U4Y6_9SPHN|nr:Abi family protein [Sphingomonas ginsenosidivorax]TXC67954.1 Abi family protein [Sphingomonas ginsenosidivorax]